MTPRSSLSTRNLHSNSGRPMSGNFWLNGAVRNVRQRDNVGVWSAGRSGSPKEIHSPHLKPLSGWNSTVHVVSGPEALQRAEIVLVALLGVPYGVVNFFVCLLTYVFQKDATIYGTPSTLALRGGHKHGNPSKTNFYSKILVMCNTDFLLIA